MARAPENTLGAFAAAYADGGDGVELDTQLSKDDVPIVLHDDTLDRTSVLHGSPRAFLASELDRADVGTWFTHADVPAPREKVPRLDEVLKAAPDGAVVNVELKGPTPFGAPLERQVLAVIAQHVPRLHVIVSSFQPGQLAVVRRLWPELPVGLLVEPETLTALRSGWPAAALRPDALHPPSALVNAALVAAVHARGMRLNVWGVADDADARRLCALGADALIVNDVKSGVAARTAASSR